MWPRVVDILWRSTIKEFCKDQLVCSVSVFVPKSQQVCWRNMWALSSAELRSSQKRLEISKNLYFYIVTFTCSRPCLYLSTLYGNMENIINFEGIFIGKLNFVAREIEIVVHM